MCAGVRCDAAALFGQARRHVADHRDLEPVEDPHAAEPDDDTPVKSRPRQPVQSGRHVGSDCSGLCGRSCGSVLRASQSTYPRSSIARLAKTMVRSELLCSMRRNKWRDWVSPDIPYHRHLPEFGQCARLTHCKVIGG